MFYSSLIPYYINSPDRESDDCYVVGGVLCLLVIRNEDLLESIKIVLTNYLTNET